MTNFLRLRKAFLALRNFFTGAGGNKDYAFLRCLILGVLILFFVLNLVSFLWTFFSSDDLEFGLCLSSSCIVTFERDFSGSLSLLKASGWSLTLISTITGIFLAVKNYLLSVNNSAISNYISHFKMFHDYVSSEIKSSQFLSIEKFDLFVWYDFMFPRAKRGNVDVSERYKLWLRNLRNCLVDENNRFKSGKESFDYNTHQTTLIDVLVELGIGLERLPKNNFYEVERELLWLIDAVNRTFTVVDVFLSKVERLYARR